MAHRNLDVLDAAERLADGINLLIARHPRRLLHAAQMRGSAQAIVANIAEGFGKRSPKDRAKSLDIARGEAEETLRHLAANFRANRITAKEYWPLHNLLGGISKMLASMLRNCN